MSLQGPASPVFFICTLSVSWFLWHCLRQLLWKRAPHANESKPWITTRKSFLSFFFLSAVSRTVFQPWHSNTVLTSVVQTYFSLIFFRHSVLQKRQSGLKITFQKLWKNAQSLQFLNCFRFICGRHQAINVFCEALVTVPMITIFWFQFLRHVVLCIFHSVYRVGRFLTSPSTDILK